MRRKDRERDAEFAREVIDRSGHGVVSFCGEGGEPYCVPLSLVRIGDELYFHCAREGRKVDLLRRFPQVCITFVGEDRPVFAAPAMYTTFFQSAIVTGPASEVTDPAEKTAALRALCQKVVPDHMDGFVSALDQSLDVTAVWKVQIAEVTGKAKLEQ